MAVVTAHRNRPDRVAKDRILHSRGREDHLFGKKMSFPVPSQPQPPGAIDHFPMNSPIIEDKFAVPQGGVNRDALRKRKASKSRPNDLRRSASTPHLGKVPLPEPGIMSPTNDKKRNKLGYHRSSIACSKDNSGNRKARRVVVDGATGHCRRRKIRCQLPLPEDAQGRCTNCIRLKKECNFYPVDQAPPVDSKPTHQARRDTAMSGAPSASSQSSPHISGASQPGSVADEAAHIHLHSPKVDQMRQQCEGGGFPVPSSTEGLGVQHQAPEAALLISLLGTTHNAPFQYAPSSGGVWTEQQPPLQQYPHQHRASIADPQYWSASSTPTTAHYSHDSAIPFTATTPATFNSPNFAYTQAGNPSFVPARSMSYGQIEGMSHQFNYQSVQYGHQETHPGYTLPSQPQFSHSTFPQHGPGSIPQQNAAPEAVPRSWSSAPSVQPPVVANHQYHQNLPPTFYAQQQPVDVYDHRPQAAYAQHGQYYTPASNPG